MNALDFDRKSLNINDSRRDGLIFDLQNTDVVLREHGSNVSYLRGQCEALIESGAYNAEELQKLLDQAPTSPYPYHGALRRSLQTRF